MKFLLSICLDYGLGIPISAHAIEFSRFRRAGRVASAGRRFIQADESDVRRTSKTLAIYLRGTSKRRPEDGSDDYLTDKICSNELIEQFSRCIEEDEERDKDEYLYD